jgi:hypothetical protein
MLRWAETVLVFDGARIEEARAPVPGLTLLLDLIQRANLVVQNVTVHYSKPFFTFTMMITYPILKVVDVAATFSNKQKIGIWNYSFTFEITWFGYGGH